MDVISKIFHSLYLASTWISFGFWPSLYIMAFCLFGGNGLYYLLYVLEKPIKSPEERKRHDKRFWWILAGQIAFAFFGLSSIYVDKTADTNRFYGLFFLYYIAAIFIMLMALFRLAERFLNRKSTPN